MAISGTYSPRPSMRSTTVCAAICPILISGCRTVVRPGAPYATPGLTTVRQPLIKMGQIAAQTVADLIEGRGEYVPEIAIEPEFVIRQSTGPAPHRQLQRIAAGALPLQGGLPAK